MNDTVTMRVELEFRGTTKELGSVMEAINALPVRMYSDRIPLPFPFPGGWPFPIFKVLSKDMITRYTKDRPAILENILGGINGGIREPHLHLGDQVVFLERADFARVVGNVAEHVTQEITMEGGYQHAVGAIRQLNAIEEMR